MSSNNQKRRTTESNFLSDAKTNVGGYGIVWNDDIDLSCDDLLENGVTVDTPFDGVESKKTLQG